MARLSEGFDGQQAYILPPASVAELKRHPLSTALHITDIGYYPHAGNHYRERRVPVSQYIFIYCTDGAGWYEMDGQRYDVLPDSYFIIPPGHPHSYGADAVCPWTIYWVHYDGVLAGEYLPPVAGPVSLRPSLKSRIADRIDIFEEIMTTLENGFGRENLLYACSVFHHFLGSLRFITQYRSGRGCHEPSGGGDDIVDAAIHYMNENIGKHLSLRALADYTGYSPSRLTALFAARTGMSPIAYFNTLKVKYACRLLDFTDMRVSMICHRVGLSDPYYFTRMFTRVMGMSPTAYRMTVKG